jgi:ABC-2 type transport system permease protein
MTRLLSAELFKLRTTRTFYGLVFLPIALLVLIVVLASALGHHARSDEVMRSLMGLGLVLSQPFALVLGVLAITTEFRHGTITPTLLVAPRRTPLLLAKLVASVLTGVALGLLASGLVALLVSAISSLRDYPDGSTGSDVLKMIVGITLGAGLYGAIGLGLGAIVRNQVGAIIGGIVYLAVLEPLLGIIPTVGDWIQKYGLGGASGALSHTNSANADNVLHQVPGGLLFAGYAVLFVVVGIVITNRRDITA